MGKVDGLYVAQLVIFAILLQPAIGLSPLLLSAAGILHEA
jgi:hypothetical protein